MYSGGGGPNAAVWDGLLALTHLQSSRLSDSVGNKRAAKPDNHVRLSEPSVHPLQMLPAAGRTVSTHTCLLSSWSGPPHRGAEGRPDMALKLAQRPSYFAAEDMFARAARLRRRLTVIVCSRRQATSRDREIVHTKITAIMFVPCRRECYCPRSSSVRFTLLPISCACCV